MEINSKALRRPPKSYNKVGTALEALIPEWALHDRSGCDCKSWVRKMNDWGVKGCEANRDAIVNRLLSQSNRLIPVLRILPEPLRRFAANSLLDKAIKNSSRV
jgi:hypothetical protein